MGKGDRRCRGGRQGPSADPQSGEATPKPVVALIGSKGTKDLVEVTVDTDGRIGSATGVITSTDSHPFWVSDQGHWVNASALRPGMYLRTSSGRTIEVISVRHYRRTGQEVHNLTVGNFHTYHVAVRGIDVLVHNAIPCADALQKTFEAANTEEKLEHVIDPAKHGFEDLAEKYGRSGLMRKIVDSLADIDDLPDSGVFEVTRIVAGVRVTIRGAMVRGVPRIGTAFRPGMHR
ncbi:polymorphic toxin-type HINT domain-containing protein [Sphaerisporangium sp. NPDC051017]|uniref:polymorphic toxin-type HINT domain-containing protein n=1 Tax=Sphaerisporangium sp. NPDC051017 TaxID=3154636 RepID=UPI003442B3E2